MTGLYVIFGGMILFATILGVYDQLARRQERRQNEQHRSA